MKLNTDKPVGIVAYGTALPAWKVMADQIALGQGSVLESGQPDLSTASSLGVESKTVPDFDEDTVTLATSAGIEAVQRLEETTQLLEATPQTSQDGPAARSNKDEPAAQSNIGALFIGSESHPYAVKPSGTMVASALGLSETMALADLQYACKAGTQGLQIVASYVASNFAQLGMAIGADTAQSKPGDVLEYTAGAGAAAFILGQGDGVLAKLLATSSTSSDTPDFWRRPGQPYPEHAGRFTGEPAYFTQVIQNATKIMNQLNLQPADFEFCVFHTPNAKFPHQAAKKLGFSKQQLEPSLVVNQIGNTYAAANMLALASVLDQARAGQTILQVSYGSGAGSDAFIWEVTPALEVQRQSWNHLLQSKIEKLKPVNYLNYQQKVSNSH